MWKSTFIAVSCLWLHSAGESTYVQTDLLITCEVLSEVILGEKTKIQCNSVFKSCPPALFFHINFQFSILFFVLFLLF